MRFPPYLFGYPMTTELWYIVVFIAALVALWILSKIIKRISEDFAGSIIIFAFILIFLILLTSFIGGGSALQRNISIFFENLFR
jgi:uncharacterized membrane protein